MPEVDLVYDDIGIATRSRVSADKDDDDEDNEEASKRSDLPMNSEVLKQEKSWERESTR